MKALALLIAPLAALSIGCGTPESAPVEQDKEAPPYSGSQGQLEKKQTPYPAGPYGADVGERIQNLRFMGFADPSSATPAELELITLADFYNPTGDGDHPKESIYGERKLPKALLLDLSWFACGPSREEAKTIFPARYADYSKRGGEFLFVLGPGWGSYGMASPVELEKLKDAYHDPFPIAIDPENRLGDLFEVVEAPQQMIIDTRTMEITTIHAAIPDEEFWASFEALLDPQ